MTGVCCEIDESCGMIRPYIFDMENCLTFGHEFNDFDNGDAYWERGSLAREILYNEMLRSHEDQHGDQHAE